MGLSSRPPTITIPGGERRRSSCTISTLLSATLLGLAGCVIVSIGKEVMGRPPPPPAPAGEEADSARRLLESSHSRVGGSRLLPLAMLRGMAPTRRRQLHLPPPTAEELGHAPSGFSLPAALLMLEEGLPTIKTIGRSRPHLGIDQVYIMHYSRNPSRLKSMRAQLHLMGFGGARVINTWDRQEVGEAERDAFFSDEVRADWNQTRHSYWPSLALKHMLALADVLAQNHSRALILEDDACAVIDLPPPPPKSERGKRRREGGDRKEPSCVGQFGGRKHYTRSADRFREDFSGWMAEVPPGSFDVVFVGGCYGVLYGYETKGDNRLGDHTWKKSESRCTSAMVVSREGARALLYSGLPLRGPLDIHLDSVAAEEEEEAKTKKDGREARPLRFVHMYPQLFGQTNEGGSATGVRKTKVSLKLGSKVINFVDVVKGG